MSLLKCPECGSEVSEFASNCLHCGCPMYVIKSKLTDFEIKYGVLVKYTGKGGDVVIPNKVNAIGNNAFSHVALVRNVTIPSGVLNIGNYAFEGCTLLKTVAIPNGVTSIGSYAFSWCNKLTTVTIPSSVTSIGVGAFDYCFNIKKINYFGTADSWCDMIFYKAHPSNIAKNFFIRNKAVTEIEITNAKNINDFAFSNFLSLTKVVIDKSVQSIGRSAFEGCTLLESVKLSSGLKKICAYTFYDCLQLNSIQFDGTIQEWQKIYKENEWSKKSSVKKVECVDGIVDI